VFLYKYLNRIITHFCKQLIGPRVIFFSGRSQVVSAVFFKLRLQIRKNMTSNLTLLFNRYEAWENDNVAQRAAKTKMPMWNGLFCAIAPEHSSQGVGSAVYKDVMRILAKHNFSNATHGQSTTKSHKATKDSMLNRLKSALPRFIHQFALLHHRTTPLTLLSSKVEQEQDKRLAQQLTNQKEVFSEPPTPLVAAISHSERSASFHESNGFHPVSRVPYHDVDGAVPFYVHMLVLDPFRSGGVPEFREKYQQQESSKPIVQSTTSLNPQALGA